MISRTGGPVPRISKYSSAPLTVTLGIWVTGRPLLRVTGEEVRQALGHAARVLCVEQVRRVWQVERLDVRQPGEQQVASLREGRCGALPEDGEYGVCDATRVLLRERPPLDRWQLLGEEGVRGRHRILERAREPALQCRPVTRPEDPTAPRVDGTGFVAGAITLNRRLDEGANELSL